LSAHVTGDLGSDLYAVRLDGTGLVRLTDTPDLTESSPAVTPDGKYVLFGRDNATLNQDYLGRVFKGTLGTDSGTGLPAITAEECITDFAGGPLEDKNCGLVSLDPTGTYALVSQGYYLRNRWLVPLADPTEAWRTSLVDIGGPWLDPATVVYAFESSSRKWFVAEADVFTGEETIIASFGKTQPGNPTPRRWNSDS